jgi:hypothetical protein
MTVTLPRALGIPAKNQKTLLQQQSPQVFTFLTTLCTTLAKSRLQKISIKKRTVKFFIVESCGACELTAENSV